MAVHLYIKSCDIATTNIFSQQIGFIPTLVRHFARMKAKLILHILNRWKWAIDAQSLYLYIAYYELVYAAEARVVFKS